MYTEARTLVSMIQTMILPAARAAGTSDATECAKRIEAAVGELKKAMKEIDEEEVGTLASANLCTGMRLGVMVKIRTLVDELEALVPAKEWPLATYDELLFDDMADCVPSAS